MKKILVMFFVFAMIISTVACGNKDHSQAGTKEFESAEAVAGTEVIEITEEDARACLYLATESWMCDMFSDSLDHGSEVSAKISADYYISEAENAPYDVRSVSIRQVKFGDKECSVIQTSSSENSAAMLKTLGYGETDGLNIVGTPHVVFHIESDFSGIYNAENWSIDVPYEISCNVVFENGQEVVVNFSDDVTGVGSGGYIELDEDSFKDYQ